MERNRGHNFPRRRLTPSLDQAFEDEGDVFNTPATNIIIAARILNGFQSTPTIEQAKELLEAACLFCLELSAIMRCLLHNQLHGYPPSTHHLVRSRHLLFYHASAPFARSPRRVSILAPVDCPLVELPSLQTNLACWSVV